MTESPSKLGNNVTTATMSSGNSISNIPIEIVSEEEMGFIEAALAATRPCFSSSSIPAICSPSRSSLFQNSVRSIQTITSFSKKRLIGSDIEDLGDFKSTQLKKNRVADQSFLYKFRKRTGLSVTDITSTEWCEKQMEFVLLFGKRKMSKAMKAGRDRHVKLEKEVVKKVKVSIESVEDAWALKFLNFITGANQLLFEGLTRELPLVGFLEGVWVVGIVDEIRMLEGKNGNPILVDTKTRARDTLPAEPQRRNGRLQLMCYKHLWDNLVADKFPSKEFFDFFSLNPHYILSKEIRENTAKAGISAKTLDEIVGYYRNTCKMLLPADNEMILRYELQKDNSVLGEDQFAYDPDWLESQIHDCLEFWFGEREASFTPEEERWKCRFCQFASMCPTNTISGTSNPVKSSSANSSPS
ncbi:exonuclease V, chloroplastic [Ricinus communis]|uniref:Exonuclease V, chloroplastic n=1 Tax=Ricinus communis TaxID=3988 RepID=B9SK33_RICCO|nr:exonuclease V, chloroplastic [Ricinus communis]EEF36023.1 conserved hypothetical protein [Ricinus communis]|eukprot:XP_002526352.1 exonuclease V, chloroplastic [Ricinus communis]